MIIKETIIKEDEFIPYKPDIGGFKSKSETGGFKKVVDPVTGGFKRVDVSKPKKQESKPKKTLKPTQEKPQQKEDQEEIYQIVAEEFLNGLNRAKIDYNVDTLYIQDEEIKIVFYTQLVRVFVILKQGPLGWRGFIYDIDTPDVMNYIGEMTEWDEWKFGMKFKQYIRQEVKKEFGADDEEELINTEKWLEDRIEAIKRKGERRKYD